ncbi:S9 family peptidase [Corynebacterium lactis]|uniref:Protease n=1 Tax=Corynebacterium lactis RW2-5 TaxID=1408189 RepID=A0A0K2H1T6_9CORY|nr:S9 family peptidase [Corynebacterium lactis]ALA68010.1 protease [Corynebacterium lactis RW2-5]
MTKSTRTPESINPPIAAKRPVTRSFHGREFVDDYEWLRDKESREVIDYLEAENAYTEAFTSDLKDISEKIFSEIKSRVQETDMSVPTRLNGWWYYSRTQEGKSYGMSCRLRADEGTGLDAWTPPTISDNEPAPGEEVILDANELAEGHDFFSLGAASVSEDGSFLAYSTDVTGDERYTLRVKDLRTGELLGDEIVGIAAGATWIGSEWIFYQKVDEAWRPDSVWRHRVGTDASEDVRVFHEPDESYWVGVGSTRSEKYLLLEASSKITSEVWYLDTSDPTGEFTCVRPREAGVEYDVDHAVISGRDMWMITHNMTGSNFALAMVPVGTFDSVEDLTELVAHRDDVRVEGVDCFAGHLAFGYRRGGIGRVALAILDTSLSDADPAQLPTAEAVKFTEMEFSEELYSAGTSGNPEWDAPVLRYGYGSFTTPSQLWQLEIASGKRVMLKEQKVRGEFDAADYVAKREWVTAADGAQIPVSIVHRADLDVSRPNPTLLYGYGSYESSMDPGFSIARLSLLDRGMVFVIAHVRGGGEMGRAWWEQGRALTKKNTFTDFVDVADFLLEKGWTTREQMVALGGSAGGMLMGVVANIAGDRFAGIQAVVPFVDSLTSMLKPELPLTVVEWDEWGDPYHDPEVYDYMASYSPYENISGEATYPKILAITSLNDTRVLYVEPAKWIAKLRDVVGDKTEPGQFLLKTEMVAGHGGVSGRYERWKQTGFEYAWIAHTAGAVEI